tara:strand:- start:20 stop:1678 length:1659 start_codon:yes stop_codon:yes gene_type:complete
MKGGSVCSNSTIEADNGQTKFQAYTYSAASVAGMDCGFFIQVNKLPDSKPVTSPSDGKPRNDIFVNISGSGKEAKATEFNVQDMFIGGSAASEVSSYRDAIDSKIDAVLQRNKDQGNPIEVIDKVLKGKENYQIIIFDSDGNEAHYLERGHTYDENNKKEPKKAEEPAGVPEPVVETPESAPVGHKFYNLTALVGTDKEGSIDVLKLKNDQVGIEITGMSPQFADDDPIINKDNFSKILCDKLKTKLLNEESPVKNQFNLSAKELKQEQEDVTTIASRESSGADLIRKTTGQVTSNIESLNEKYSQKKLSNLKNQDLDDTINNYNVLLNDIEQYKELKQEGYNTINEPLTGLEQSLKTGIFSKICGQGCTSLDKNQLYNFLLTIKNNLLQLNKIFNKIVEAVDTQHILVQKTSNYISNLTGYNKSQSIDSKEVQLASTSIPRELVQYYFTARYFKINTKSLESSKTHKEKREISKRKWDGRSAAFNSAKKTLKRMTGYQGQNKPQGDEQVVDPDQMDARMAPLSGGKRKTRKIKARKTRRNVQKKRRQSKKH